MQILVIDIDSIDTSDKAINSANNMKLFLLNFLLSSSIILVSDEEST